MAILTALSLVVSPAAPLLAAPAAPQAARPDAAPAGKPAAPAKTAGPEGARPPPRLPKPAATAAAVDGGWPRAYSTPSGGRIVVYQPQVASWDEQRHMVAYAAVAWEAKGATKPALGSLKIEADTKVSASERLVNFSDLKITESNFPTLPRSRCARWWPRSTRRSPTTTA